MRVLFVILFVFSRVSFAGPMPISESEFLALADELAPKVNLFRDVWAVDPHAEFFAGTTRDYLYWLKGELLKGKTPAALRALKMIDVREFVSGDSDVDIVTRSAHLVDPTRYGVKKLDKIDPNRFQNGTKAFADEVNQGYIPTEKIRIGYGGIIRNRDFGKGAARVSGRPTPSSFGRSDGA